MQRSAKPDRHGPVAGLRRPHPAPNRALRPVVQLERTGCGIASVAVIAGVGYREVQRTAGALGITAEDPRLWSETGYVRRLLRRYGIRAGDREVPFSSWAELPLVALLAINWRRVRHRAFWHWVVYWRSPGGPIVLDSKRTLRSHVRRDFGRMKPKWFIPVR